MHCTRSLHKFILETCGTPSVQALTFALPSQAMTDTNASPERAGPPGPEPGDPARLLPPPPDDSTVLLSWPVGTVAEQFGVSTSTLRSWERRYGLGPTRRTGGNHRRYGPTDVFRVRLMA